MNASVKYIIIGLVAGIAIGGFVLYANASFNEQINYQGKLSTSAGVAVTDGSYCMKFVIYDDLTAGSELWSEEWKAGTSKVPVTSGLFSILLGTHSSLSSVDLNSASRYLEVQLDAACDDVYEEVFAPRKQFGAVPAAFEAKQLGGATWAAPGSIGSGTPAAGAFTTLSASNILTTSNGSILSSAAGVLTLGGSGGTYNENLTLDFESTENIVAVGTGTGVTGLNLGALNFTTTGAGQFGTIADGTASLTAGSLTGVKLGSLTSNGFVKTSGGDGTLSIDTSTYLTSGDLSGYVPYTGATTTLDLGAHDFITTGTGTFGQVNITNEQTGIQFDGNTFIKAVYTTGSGTDNLFIGGGIAIPSINPALANTNTGIGAYALTALTEGKYNTAIGPYAGWKMTTGIYNTLIGPNAGLGLTATDQNTLIGYNTMIATSSATYTTIIGSSAGTSSTGSYGVIIGGNSGTNATGAGNVIVGYGAGNSPLTTGSYNVLVGYDAEAYGSGDLWGTSLGGQSKVGSYGVSVGRTAGKYETADYKLFIDTIDRTNEATARTSSLIYGVFNSTVASQSITFNVGSASFGAGNVSTTGTITGSTYYSGATVGVTCGSGAVDSSTLGIVTGCVASDVRYKEDITELDSALDKITKIRGVTYDWNENYLSLYPNASKERQIGMVAQEVQKQFPELVAENPDGSLTIRYMYFAPVLLEAIKELNQKVDVLAGGSIELSQTGTIGTGQVSGIDGVSLGQSLIDLGISIVDGVATLREVVADTFTAKTAKIGTAEINKIIMVDQATGDKYCTWIENGEWKKSKGDCESVATDSVFVEPETPVVTEPEIPEEATPEETAPTTETPVVTEPEIPEEAIPEETTQGTEQETEQPQTLDIVSVSSISSINIDYGTDLASANLPATVVATLSDDSTQNVTITWDSGTPAYDASTSGIYAFSGTLDLPADITNTNDVKANTNIVVAENPAPPESEAPAETPADAISNVIQDTASALLNGIRNFIRWIFSSGSKTLSSIPVVQEAGVSLSRALTPVQSWFSSDEVKSLTVGLLNPIMKLFGNK